MYKFDNAILKSLNQSEIEILLHSIKSAYAFYDSFKGVHLLNLIYIQKILTKLEFICGALLVMRKSGLGVIQLVIMLRINSIRHTYQL
jgi:hypothetical protein